MNSFTVTINPTPRSSKPANWGTETALLKHAPKMSLDPARFCEAMRLGCTWVGGCFGNALDVDTFESQQLFAIDIDNGRKESGKKIQLVEGDAGFLDPVAALTRCYGADIRPLCLYFTFSATLDSPRYRIVFDMGEPITDREEAEEILATLLDLFPEADAACRNTNRLYAGSNGEVWECWRCDIGE